MTSPSPDSFLQAALDEARQGLIEGGIPIGSVLVIDGQIVGKGHNRRVQRGSAILHAEMDAIENAGRLKASDYRRAVLYSTLSPCDMCSGTALLYRIPKIVIGENRTFRGPEEYVRSRGVELTVLDDLGCIQLMEDFIRNHSSLWNEDIGGMTTLQQKFDDQQFSNGYELVNGVAMHAENPDHFHVPPDVIKRHIRPGQFVELRIDSSRFSVHEDAPEKCTCPSCNGEMTKPILRHEQPASLMPLPKQSLPSRGWGEDFWVKVTERSGSFIRGIVDNPFVEARLHGLKQSDEIIFHEDHILAVHDTHRQEIVARMDAADLKELALWLRSLRD